MRTPRARMWCRRASDLVVLCLFLFLWFSRGFLRVFLRVFYFFLGFIWFSFGFLWFSQGFLRVF